jgi:predicted phosphoribosyltransferase
LGAPLDVFVVRKLGVPGHRELAMGAIASGGLLVINPDVVQELGITRAVIEAVSASETQELQRREHDYRADRQPIALRGKSVILVDDGLATGASMRAAVAAVKAFDPARVVVAVPVAASEVCRRLEAEVDEVVCAVTPPDFAAVGFWYEDFSQTTDDEVRDLLHLHTQC